jgi:DNA primase
MHAAYNRDMDEVVEIKQRLEIAEVVGAYVPLKQSGRNLKAPCPFHQEKTASFMVSPEKGIYHCFGCGEGGDIFSFVQKMEGLDFRGALEMLARKAGVELKERRGDNSAARKLQARLLDAHELAVKYFQASLVQNQKALDYVVKKRGLNRETIKTFQIGYAPDSWEALTGWLRKKGFTAAELLQAGLAGQKEGRSTVYDLFRGRIMFTICDREGRPVGFTGRVLDDSVPKYLNTPQTPLYDKSQLIFGLHLAKEAVRQSDEVVLVEGQMDVVASHQAGVKQVVAASGTALTVDHLRTLSKLTKNIKLAFDADRAGLAATERAIEMGQRLGLTLNMVVLPDGVKDADELISQDVEAWRQAILGAKYIVDYLFERFERDFDLTTAVGKRGYAERLAANLRRLGDPVEQDHYVKLLAEKTGTSEEAVRAKITGEDKGAQSSNREHVAKPGVEVARRAVVQAEGRPSARVVLEEELLGLTLAYPSTRICLDDLRQEHFSSVERKRAFQIVTKHKAETAEVMATKEQGDAVQISRLQLIGENEFSDLESSKQQFEAFELTRRVIHYANAELKRELGLAIQEAEKNGDKAAVEELLGKFQEIIKAEA